MTDPTTVQIVQLRHQLEASGDPKRAPAEQAYLKSPLTHLGVGVPGTRRAVRAWIREQGYLNSTDIWQLVDALWRSPIYELRLGAVESLTYRSELLQPTDLPRVRRMISESFTWALVDPLAIDVVGSLIGRMESGSIDATLDPWTVDHSFWVRRASLLCHLRMLRDPLSDPSRFFRYADAMLDEREFFIRKAIGWVLRDMSRKRPNTVFDWLEPRANRASGVTIREAVKYLSADQKEAIASVRARGAIAD